jgi:hypothetical protein
MIRGGGREVIFQKFGSLDTQKKNRIDIHREKSNFRLLLTLDILNSNLCIKIRINNTPQKDEGSSTAVILTCTERRMSAGRIISNKNGEDRSAKYPSSKKIGDETGAQSYFTLMPGIRGYVRYLNVLLQTYMSTCYVDRFVCSISDCSTGGFLIAYSTVNSTEVRIVPGISSVLTTLSTKEGERQIKAFYKQKRTVRINPAPGKSTSGRGVTSAVDRGLRIHQLVYHEIECIMNGSAHGGSDSIVSGGASCRGVDCCLCPEETRLWLPWNKSEREDVRLFFSYLVNDMKLLPVCSELPLFDEKHSIATRVDVLCVDQSGDLILISLKTGIFGRPEKKGETSETFIEPFETLKDSIRHRHDLQLWIEMSILIGMYSLPIRSGYIIYCTKGATPPICMRNASDILVKLRWSKEKMLDEIYKVL